VPLALLPLALPAAALANGVPACASAPCASDRGPILLLSYYRGGRNLAKLVRVVNGAHLPRGVPVYYGDYWGSGAHHQHVPRPPGGKPRPRMEAGRYAPIFTIRPSTFWHGLPSLAHLIRRSAHRRYRVGRVLGRRFRDRIREERAKGRRVVTWQLDELPSELGGRQGARVRTFVNGVVHGLAYGRRRLGDRKLPGIVFAAPKALARAGRPTRHRAWRRFWHALDRATLYLVGEEYPAFAGSPRRAANRADRLRRRIWRHGGARRRLARKYVAGMTPGYRLLKGLGGNVHHMRRRAVASWRRRFVRARAREDLAGLGQYLLAYGNARTPVLRDVLSALVQGARRLR
jgi:hypothetical protein